MHLHYSFGGPHWVLPEQWHFIVISVDRAINNVQQFIKPMNVIIRWQAQMTSCFLISSEKPVSHSKRLCLLEY